MKPSEARVLLTGATGGIGRTMAARLLGEGAAVMLVARSPDRLAALARSLAGPARAGDDAGRRIAWHAADVGDAASLGRIREVAAEWRTNVLINNAGVSSFGRLGSLTPEHMEQVLQTNLLAPMRLTQSLLPLLSTRSRAQVIQVGSALGRLALPGFSVYCASKFGLRGFSEALRRELADTPVRIQYLGPRSTRTAFNNDAVMRFNADTGTTMDTPEVVAEALLELLRSEKAERFVGFPEAMAVRINGLAPVLLDGAFAKHRRCVPAPAVEPDGGPASANDPGKEDRAGSLARPWS